MFSHAISQILIYLTDLSQFLNKHIGSANLAKLHYSWLAVLFFIFVFFLIGLNLGRSRMLLALLAIYAAAFIEPLFVYLAQVRSLVKNQPEYIWHIGLFLLIYLAVLFILNRSILRSRLTLKESSLISVALMAIAEIGFLASVIAAYLPPEALKSVPVGLIQYLATKTARFWWAVMPLIITLLLKKEKTSP